MVAVTTTLSNSLPGSARMVFRTSEGIPVVLHKQSATTWFARVGNAIVPTNFGSGAGSSDNTEIDGLSGALDSNDILHVSWIDIVGKASRLRYTTVDCTIPQAQTVTNVIPDIGETPFFGQLFTAIAVDSNNVPHIVFTGYPKIAGVVTYTANYINKIGGSWNSGIDVYQVKSDNCYEYDILINSDNIPVISMAIYLSAVWSIATFIGDANNATLFTQKVLGNGDSIVVTSVIELNDRSIIVAKNNGSSFVFYKHTYGESWATWSTMGSWTNTATSISLVSDGIDIWAFYEDNNHDVVYRLYSSGSWGTAIVLHTGTFNTVRARWAKYFDNGSMQTETILEQNTATGSSIETFDLIGQSFAGIKARLSKVTFTTSSPSGGITGNLYAQLYEVASLSTPPAGTPIARSINSFDVSAWSTSPVARTWVFNKANIESGKYYAIVLDVPSLGSSQRINLYYGYTSNTLDGHLVYGTSTDTDDATITIYTQPQINLIDYVYVDETATPDIQWGSLSLSAPASWITKPLKWFNGSAWVEKPLKYYNGSTWVTKPVKSNL